MINLELHLSFSLDRKQYLSILKVKMQVLDSFWIVLNEAVGVAAFACPCVPPRRLYKTATDKLPSVNERNFTDMRNFEDMGQRVN